MTRFLATRALLLLVGLAVAAILIFFTLRVLPGDVALTIGGTQATPEQIAHIRRSLGLDQPVLVQFGDWVAGLLHGDLGQSLLTGVPVADDIGRALTVTLPLAGLSLVFGLAIGIPLGVVSAVRHRRFSGFAISAAAQAVAAIPIVFIGMLLAVGVGLYLRWLPVQGFPNAGWANPRRAFDSLILPALSIALVEGAVLLRFTRSAALEAMSQDFVRTAAAKGMTRTRALVTHGLPNVILSVVSVLGIQLAALLVGAVLVEVVFQLPGLGKALVDDVGNRDLVKVQGELLVITALILVVGFVVDVVHRLVDPRERQADGDLE
ncbi:ABC transporter permease [Gryllotalpicola sp.]|uniref:ABC transporter permease n=1 Tax=Gryllotalpicola sp. TaxID=1932787 RepID=UPI00262ECF43|nr:ABC transporter permease [Gryllotalpicola sp.]